MLSQIYPDNYGVGGLNRQPIIMITYNENTLSTNNGQQKIWTLDRYKIL